MDTQTPSREEKPKAAMPFLEHLEELRRRLIKSMLAVIVGAAVGLIFQDQLMAFIQEPLKGTKLYNMEVAGEFYAYLKVSLFAGIFVALPVVFYQLWGFVSPGLYKREKRMVLPLVATSTLLFLAGAGFCFYVMMPFALAYLIGFSDGTITSIVSIGSYLSFVGFLMLAFGIAFQMPILAYFLGRMGVISARFMGKGRRYAVVILLTIAAILTPPDVFTQVMLFVPLYALYEVSILVVWFATRRRREQREAPAG